MAPGGRWCCQTIFGPPGIARVMRMLEDSERLRVVARRRDTYKLSGDCSRMTTPIQYRCLVLLSHRNHMSPTRALEIDFRCATEVHLPDQIVRYKLHYDGTRVSPFNFAREHQNCQLCHWRPVLFTDENSFTESTNDRRARVLRCQGERYADGNIAEVDRYDGGSS